MLDIEANTKTAGAYVLYGGYFPFMFGFGANHGSDELGVVRLGGHRESGETAIQCAAREVREESSLDTVFYENRTIYVGNPGGGNYEKIEGDRRDSPIFVMRGRENELSVMYLAHGKGTLAPKMETQGVLLLRAEDIERICPGRITLSEYKKSGGKCILAGPLPEDAVFVPHIQLRFLNKLFTLERELMADFMKSYPPI